MGNHKAIGYQTLTRRILLKGALTLQSGLHIGAGRALGASASELPVLKDINGNPYIPGSSLKGVLRSNVEAFLRSFQGRTRVYLACCQVGGGEDSKDPTRCPCVTAERKEKLLRKLNSDELIWEESCWVCKFFGSPWIASKVQFVDLPLTSAWAPEFLSVRDGVAIDRESETAAPRALFDFEVVPPGTQFFAEIIVENPEDYELGFLALGFDFLNDGFALIGGNTSRGLGRVRFDLDEVIEVKPDDILARLRSEEAPTPSKSQSEETASSFPSAEAVQHPADEAQRAVLTCLEKSGRFNHSELVSTMQQQGWTKARLQEHGYANYKELFEKSVQAGVIARTEEQFHLPGKAPAAVLIVPDLSQSAEENEGSSKKQKSKEEVKKWKDALYRKLKEALEGGEQNVQGSL